MAQRSVQKENEWLKVSDEELLTLYYSGNDEAFGEFDQRYRQQLAQRAYGRISPKRAARRELAEDLASSTLGRVFETKDQRPHARWNPSRGDVARWIGRILRNQVISCLRSRRGKELLDTDSSRDASDGVRLSVLELLAATKIAIESTVENQELRQLLHQAIERLPVEHQRTVHLRFWDGLTFDQIGTELGVSTATAYRLLTAAQGKLRGSLRRHSLSA